LWLPSINRSPLAHEVVRSKPASSQPDVSALIWEKGLGRAFTGRPSVDGQFPVCAGNCAAPLASLYGGKRAWS